MDNNRVVQTQHRARALTRRDFVKSAGVAATAAGMSTISSDGMAGAQQMPPLTHLSAKRLAELIADREVSAVEVVDSYLRRIEEVNPKLNAVIQMDADRIRAEARQADKDLGKGVTRGPLHGVPFTIKDQLLTKGIVTTNGCPELRQYVPKRDATVVKRLRDAGGILLGKTNVPEMCYQSISDNLVYGQSKNPYDLSCTPGGSSGGEAAIIAACGSPLGLGTDVGDSIRAPAHFCGIAAMKPTCRRVPETGMLSALPVAFADWNCIGPMTRHVEDIELALRIVSGPDGEDPYVAPVRLGNSSDISVARLRIAICPDDVATSPTEETQKAVKNAANALRAAGASLVECRPPMIEQVQDIWLYNILPLWESAAKYYPAQYAKMTGSKVAGKRHFSTELTIEWLESWKKERDFDADSQVELQAVLQQYREDMMRFMTEYDAILSPVANKPAAPHPDPKASLKTSATEAWESFKTESGGFCMAHNLTGWPAAVIRAGTSADGLPIGVQIAAKPWREDVALAVAAVIEDRVGGWQPPNL